MGVIRSARRGRFWQTTGESGKTPWPGKGKARVWVGNEAIAPAIVRRRTYGWDQGIRLVLARSPETRGRRLRPRR